MGWWSTSESGVSFMGDGSLVWGDSPADLMDDAIDSIKEIFVRDVGRLPSKTEIIAGVYFTLGGAEDLPDVPLPGGEAGDQPAHVSG